MKSIDLHGHTWAEAREIVIEAYNDALRPGWEDCLDVVHGYGASGQGGKLRSALRTFLSTYGVEFRPGEVADRNPGHTIVYPGQPLPTVTGRLQMDILAFCESPKTKEQIYGKFRRHGVPALDAAMRTLQSTKMLATVAVGKVKKFERV